MATPAGKAPTGSASGRLTLGNLPANVPPFGGPLGVGVPQAVPQNGSLVLLNTGVYALQIMAAPLGTTIAELGGVGVVGTKSVPVFTLAPLATLTFDSAVWAEVALVAAGTDPSPPSGWSVSRNVLGGSNVYFAFGPQGETGWFGPGITQSQPIRRSARFYFLATGTPPSAGLTPPVGKRWRLLGAGLTLVAGSTAGTRSANLKVYRSSDQQTAVGEVIAYIPGETGTSQTYYGSGGPSDATAAGVTQGLAWGSEVVVTQYDELVVGSTLISGDTLAAFITFIEEDAM